MYSIIQGKDRSGGVSGSGDDQSIQSLGTVSLAGGLTLVSVPAANNSGREQPQQTSASAIPRTTATTAGITAVTAETTVNPLQSPPPATTLPTDQQLQQPIEMHSNTNNITNPSSPSPHQQTISAKNTSSPSSSPVLSSSPPLPVVIPIVHTSDKQNTSSSSASSSPAVSTVVLQSKSRPDADSNVVPTAKVWAEKRNIFSSVNNTFSMLSGGKKQNYYYFVVDCGMLSMYNDSLEYSPYGKDLKE